MLQTLFLFNPESDLALANGDENYVPPAQALRMGADLAFLPAWYAPEGSSLWSPEFRADRWFGKEYEGLLPAVRCLDKNSGAFAGLAEISPWGWNAMLAKKLRLAGVPGDLIPPESRLARIRDYSHRSFSVVVLEKLLGREWLCGSAVCLRSEPDVKSFVEAVPDGVLKAPWSGSGKGLFWYQGGVYSPPLSSWVNRILAKQGCLIAERSYCKQKDFAMEFYSDGTGTVSFAGYSLFRTDGRGAYHSNLLASGEAIENRLARFTGREALKDLRKELELLLSREVGGFYKGYLGVDMMVCRFGESPYDRIHPCVEINLRMNMGMVSRLFFDRFVAPDRQGCFAVDYFKTTAGLWNNHRQLAKKYPLIVEDGKIRSGYLSLTPVGKTTRYRASARIV